MAKMVEMNARGVVEVNKYGLLVDGESLLEELLKHFGEYNEFAGSVHIIVSDETEPLEVLTGNSHGEMLANHMKRIPGGFDELLDALYGVEEDEPAEEAGDKEDGCI